MPHLVMFLEFKALLKLPHKPRLALAQADHRPDLRLRDLLVDHQAKAHHPGHQARGHHLALQVDRRPGHHLDLRPDLLAARHLDHLLPLNLL